MPTSTPTPLPLTGDPRFGVVTHTLGRSDTRYFLEQLGVNQYLNFRPSLAETPNGAVKVPFVQMPGGADVWNSGQAQTVASMTDSERAAIGFTTEATIDQMAALSPGSYWYIFGEANRYGFITPTRFAPVFNYYVNVINRADPTAKIIGTSILNWDFTCLGCGGRFLCEGVFRVGYGCGKVWLKQFISMYENLYGEKPPVDVWAIDTYPIDWVNKPNSEIHASIVISQLEGMRAYLDSVPEYVGTPIWITEIAVHLGYDDWQFGPSGGLVPVGAYHWDDMSDYLLAVLNWLEVEAAGLNIEKWFLFITWKDIVSESGDGYMGIVFFKDRSPSSLLNCLGDTYRSRALQYLASPPPKVKCDSSGNTVAE
jgi:hypothetical protein